MHQELLPDPRRCHVLSHIGALIYVVLCLKSCSLLSLMNCYPFFKTQLKCLLFWETFTSCHFFGFLFSLFILLRHTATKDTKICLLQLIWVLPLIYRHCKLWPMAKSSLQCVFINKVLLETVIPNCSCITYGCFHTIMAELSSWDRGCMAHKA